MSALCIVAAQFLKELDKIEGKDKIAARASKIEDAGKEIDQDLM